MAKATVASASLHMSDDSRGLSEEGRGVILIVFLGALGAVMLKGEPFRPEYPSRGHSAGGRARGPPHPCDSMASSICSNTFRASRATRASSKPRGACWLGPKGGQLLLSRSLSLPPPPPPSLSLSRAASWGMRAALSSAERPGVVLLRLIRGSLHGAPGGTTRREVGLGGGASIYYYYYYAKWWPVLACVALVVICRC